MNELKTINYRTRNPVLLKALKMRFAGKVYTIHSLTSFIFTQLEFSSGGENNTKEQDR